MVSGTGTLAVDLSGWDVLWIRFVPVDAGRPKTLICITRAVSEQFFFLHNDGGKPSVRHCLEAVQVGWSLLSAGVIKWPGFNVMIFWRILTGKTEIAYVNHFVEHF